MARLKDVKKPKNVEEYLASVPEPARATLKKIRAAIRSAVRPEGISRRSRLENVRAGGHGQAKGEHERKQCESPARHGP